MKNRPIFYLISLLFAAATIYAAYEAITYYWANWFIVAITAPLAVIMLIPKYTSKWF